MMFNNAVFCFVENPLNIPRRDPMAIKQILTVVGGVLGSAVLVAGPAAARVPAELTAASAIQSGVRRSAAWSEERRGAAYHTLPGRRQRPASRSRTARAAVRSPTRSR